jgi:hypothetical protein
LASVTEKGEGKPARTETDALKLGIDAASLGGFFHFRPFPVILICRPKLLHEPLARFVPTDGCRRIALSGFKPTPPSIYSAWWQGNCHGHRKALQHAAPTKLSTQSA